MNKPISYLLAKLLKEKGFEYLQTEDNDYELGRHSYFKHYKSGEIHPLSHYYFDTNANSVQWTSLNINAPTIADVIMWLYEKHHKFISVVNEPNVHNFKWVVTNLSLIGYKRYIHSDKLKEMNEEETEYLYQHYFNSPTEAYEAGIRYCLEKVV